MAVKIDGIRFVVVVALGATVSLVTRGELEIGIFSSLIVLCVYWSRPDAEQVFDAFISHSYSSLRVLGVTFQFLPFMRVGAGSPKRSRFNGGQRANACMCS